MAAKRTINVSWVALAWTVGITVVGFISTVSIFYATTNSTFDKHSKALDNLAAVLKDESKARTEMEKAEATAREKLRGEYLAMMERQTVAFSGASEKIGLVSTEVKVLGAKHDAISEQLKKVIEQTSPTATGSIGRARR